MKIIVPISTPFRVPLAQTKLHVLEFALQSRAEDSRKLLSALLVGSDNLFRQEADLDANLAGLEGRGLLAWDRQANRYEVRPALRAVVLNRLDENTQRRLYAELA